MMNEKFISSLHIEKLGHKIEEIRIRALNNILLKLQQNFTYDNELARSLELLKKLMQWFDFPNFTEEDKVLTLIKDILKSKSGQLLINHLGASKIRDDLQKIRAKINTAYYDSVDEILTIFREAETVPILEGDLPLSYRSDQTDKCDYRSRVNSESTSYNSPPTFQVSDRDLSELKSSRVTDIRRDAKSSGTTDNLCEPSDNLPFVTLKWQNLVSSDCHVLKSLEESLRNPSEPSTLLHSCEFFCNVILQDFPAEVFLQRTAIVTLFHEFVNNCPSLTITNSSLLCLNSLTDKLLVRLKFYKDPAMYCVKTKVSIDEVLDINIDKNNKSIHNSEVTNQILNLETREDDLLKLKQISLQEYCINTMFIILCYISEKQDLFKDEIRRRKIKRGMNLALDLFDKLSSLMILCIKPSVWSNNTNNLSLINKLSALFQKLGDVLNQFCLKMCAEVIENFERIIQLHLLHSTCVLLKNMVPLSSVDKYLPRSLKNSLSNCLLDASFSRIYPSAHETLVQYVKEFEGSHELQSLKKYKDVQQICNSMSSAVKFIKNNQDMDIKQSLYHAKESLPSLEFHRNLTVINHFLKICIDFYPVYSKSKELQDKMDYVMLKLLSHSDEEIQIKMYSDCQKLILNSIGVKFSKPKIPDDPGSQILFFFRTNVFIELICHGLSNKNLQISAISEDILIHVLKCKILVSDSVWNKLIQVLIPAFPLLHCYADLETPLGKTVIRMVDPDVSSSLSIPQLEVIKGNLRFLFNNDLAVRNEAVSRLCWLLTLEKDAELRMPKITYLKDCGLSNIFQCDFSQSAIKSSPHHLYQASSLYQVMELLSSPKVEPTIRRSALTQISVMLEDNFLHSVFLENNGLELVLEIFRKSSYKNEYHNYQDSVLSIVMILKNICLYNSGVRHQLSANENFFFSFLRALFLYSTEKRMQTDGALLLALLVYSEFSIYNSANLALSLPNIVIERTRIPFKCCSHWKQSPHTLPSLFAIYKSDAWSQSAVRMHWNIEWFRRVDELIANSQLNCNKSNYDQSEDFNVYLRLNDNDLLALKATSAVHCCQTYLHDIQNATTHNAVYEAVQGLVGYVNLWTLITKSKMCSVEDTFLSLPWKENFLRFLSAPPASTEDQNLLTEIIHFLSQIVTLSTALGKHSWISDIIKDPSHYFYKLLKTENESDSKNISLEILQLVIVCAAQERCEFHRTFIYGQHSDVDRTKSWMHIVQIISENLKFRETDQFYNLAYIDKLLACLVEISSNSGWSKTCPYSVNIHKTYTELIESLSELLLAFHYGKGPEAFLSFMGFNITRNTLFVMNHILAEMQDFYKKAWEPYWVRENVCGATLLNLKSLWSSRDVIVRAEMMHFLVGLAYSPRGATKIVECVHQSNGGIWELTLAILLDHTEASVVREKAAYLLANLTSHVNINFNKQVSLPSCHAPMLPNNKLSGIETAYKLLNQFNFFEEINKCICLYSKKAVESEIVSSIDTGSVTSTQSSRKSSDKSENNTIVTPSLVTSVVQFLSNIVYISPTKTTESMIDQGLIRSLFRCYSSPLMTIEDNKDVYLYRDILEMFCTVCALLKNCVMYNFTCSNILLHTRDSLYVLVSLLQFEHYDTRSNYFVSIRNKLWLKIYQFLSTIINCDIDKHVNGKSKINESYNILTSIITQCGYEAFFKVVFESVTSKELGLQQASLQFITSLFSLELTFKENQEKANFFKCLLDQTKSLKYLEEPKYKSQTFLSEEKSLSDTYTDQLLSNRKPAQSNSDVTTNKVVYFNVTYIGSDFCQELIKIYETNNLKNEKDFKYNIIIIKSLSVLLNISDAAKKCAFDNKLIDNLLAHLRQLHLELSLHSAEALRKISEKKKVCPILKEAASIFNLLTNFISNNTDAKISAANSGLADLAHKFWIWFTMDHTMMVNMLKMLCTLTVACENGCSSLILTNKSPGSGPRKLTSSLSLMHAVLNLITKEMELVSRSHSVTILNLCFEILENVCCTTECRVIISKSNIFQSLNRLHPAITKLQNNWEIIESMWLHFILTFTYHPEGQVCIVKSNDTFDLIVLLASSSKSTNRTVALAVLRNLSFHQPNKIKLLTSIEFIQILHTKLQIGSLEEKNIVISIIWALIANSQRSKIAVKCAGLDTRLCDLVKQWQFLESESKFLKVATYVLGLLRDKEK